MTQKTMKIEDDPKESILIVEDDASLRFALSNKLIAEGYHVFLAQDGKEGLGIALKEHPSLMLIDIVMPIMDGMTMIKELRKNEWGSDARAIILTNLSDAEKTAEAIDRRVYDILVKSDWKLEDVVNKIKDVLKS